MLQLIEELAEMEEYAKTSWKEHVMLFANWNSERVDLSSSDCLAAEFVLDNTADRCAPSFSPTFMLLSLEKASNISG